MKHPSDFGGLFVAEDRENIVMSVPVVDDERAAEAPGKTDLPAKGFFLDARGTPVPIVIQTDFADGHDFGTAAREFFQFLQGGIGKIGGIVRMNTYGGINGRILFGQFYAGNGTGYIATDCNHMRNARLQGALDDLSAIAAKLPAVEMRMGVNQRRV
jgi:hypothetical protein